jgi:hypothetical protein
MGIGWSIASGVELAMSVEAGLQNISPVWRLESIESQQVGTMYTDIGDCLATTAS